MPIAVITGGTKGIGRAIAEKLLAEGFDIAVCSRTTAELEECREQWLQQFPGRKVLVKVADMQDKAQVKDFAGYVLQEAETVAILVNNAGLYFPGSLAEEPEGQLESLLATNLLSAYHITRAFLPGMKERKAGHIFNMCSVASLRAYPNGGAYSITKYALLGFSDNLRYELKDEGIKVTAISPGAVWSNSWSGSGVPPERIMKAEDIAALLWTTYNLSAQATVEHIVLRPQLGDL
jgi:short-subunit dehydrogenase